MRLLIDRKRNSIDLTERVSNIQRGPRVRESKEQVRDSTATCAVSRKPRDCDMINGL